VKWVSIHPDRLETGRQTGEASSNFLSKLLPCQSSEIENSETAFNQRFLNSGSGRFLEPCFVSYQFSLADFFPVVLPPAVYSGQ